MKQSQKNRSKKYNFKLLLPTSYCSDGVYNQIDESQKTNQQTQKFFRLLTEGFKFHKLDIDVFSKFPANRKNYKKIIFRHKKETIDGVTFSYATIINIPLVKNILFFIEFFIYLAKSTDKKTVIVLDIYSLSSLICSLIISKIKKIFVLGIVTDIPIVYAGNFGKRQKFSDKINFKLAQQCNAYILLTKEMNNLINPLMKPNIIIEGFSDIKMLQEKKELNDNNKFICMYAGGIKKIYGIEMLIEGFIKADIDNSELHIYGSGSYEDELKEKIEKEKNIFFRGIKNNDFIIKAQEKASLLINPRLTGSAYQYTRFSFPSKNMEYMASGTPVLTTKLPGMPKEYHKYVFFIEKETSAGIANNLVKISNMKKEDLFAFGLQAKKWILTEKNNIVQTKKIIDFIENIKND